MDKKTFGMIVTVVAIMIVALLISAMPGDNILTKEKDTTIINTQLLGKNIKGYRGATPVKIYVFKNKIAKVEALPNRETPKFFYQAKTLLTKYNGKSVNKALKMNVDGVSGATFSSKALKKNVQLGLEYYKQHK